MTTNQDDMTRSQQQPVLGPAEASRRAHLLAELHKSLGDLGVPCVLARTHRLVLRFSQPASQPSGPTDPRLYAYTPHGTRVITTDGSAYALPDGQSWPVTNPAAAAGHIVCRQPAAGHNPPWSHS